MYPQSNLRRPRRTLDHLFGDDADLETVVSAIDPNVRARRVLPPPPEAPPPVVVPAARPSLVESDPEATRLRRTQPRDYIADDSAYLRELQTAPVERSRAKSAGAGFLRHGIFGAITGALQPDQYGQMKRNREIKRVEDRIGGELDVQKAQQQVRQEPLRTKLLESQIAENEAQAKARMRPPRPILGREVTDDGTTIQTELNPETGVFEPSVREGKPIVLSRPKPQEPMVEMTLSDGRKVMVSPSSALGADATRESRLERSQTKADEQLGQKLAAQDEFDQLTADEAAAGDEKNRAYSYLEQLKKDPNVTEDDIREATRAAEAANTFYRSFGPKKSAAKAKITRYSGSARPDRPLPGVSESAIRTAAKAKGLDPEKAVERAKLRKLL